MALGASVAVAQDPTFTYTDSKTSSIKDIPLTGVKDYPQGESTTTNLHWDSQGDYLLLKTVSNTTVNGIELNFNQPSALYQNAGFVTQINTSQNTVTNVTFTNDSGKGLKINDGSSTYGTGTFKVQLANTFANITKPTINLNFNSTTDNIALYGNLEISGGASSDLSTIINFGGDLKGNLSITKYYEHVSKNNEITFNNSGKLDGNLLNDGGNLTLKFMENGGITGNITSYGTSIIKVENGTLKLGDSSNKNISIISGGGMQATNTLTASKIEAHIEKLEVQGNSNSNNDNTITADEGTIQITTLSATSTAGNASNHNQNNITLSNGTLTIGSITADNYNKNNITLGGTGTITGNITQNGNSQNNFTLLGNSSTLILQGSNNAITSLTSSGGTLQLDSGSSGITLTAKTLDGVLAVSFKGNQTGNLTIEGGTHTLSNISFESSSKGNLKLQNTHTTIASSVNATTNNTLDLTLTNSTLNLNGGEITSVTSNGSASNNIINFNSGTTTIKSFSASSSTNGLSLNLDGGNLSLQNITADGTTGGTGGSNNSASIDIKVGNNSTLLLDGTNKINSLSGNGGSIKFVGTASGASSIGTISNASSKTFNPRSTLTTKTFSGDLNAIVYASKTSADQIIVTDTGSTSSGTLTILAQGDIHEILSITQADDVVVAKVGSSSSVKVQGGESVIDGMVLDLIVQEKSGGSSGEYIIGKSVNKGIENSIQEVTNTALTVNYDLFLANFNSLNKRMGELRDNPYSQGVWARVFGGAMSNEFGSGSKTEYVTLQAGYDYSLALGDARNYMGIALAYGSSWTKANDGIGATTSSLSNVNSSMVEVGIYNSYVMDSGWYNDTIFKFDYIMSDFTLTAGSNTSDNSTNNFAIILSDEFGYRYKFGGDKSWYIDPQVEVGFGYFNQSDFNHALNATTTMTATQDTILTLRTRAGASLGKKFTAQKGFASVYVGAFYEYDYINGGDAETTLSGGLVGNQLNNLKSNGRAIVNIGSNIELSEGVRMYIDVEKSFGNKQRVDMQFNFGARYSFGERASTPNQNNNIAPLKIQNQ